MQQEAQHVQIAIVGAGFSGLGMAIRLRQEGFQDFLILERADDLGGVWRDNTYPGAACDVESHLYSFSFAPNPGWSRAFSPQAEIQAYLRRCAHEHQLMPHIRFGHTVLGASYDNASGRWQLRTSQGAYVAKILMLAVGGLSEPALPDLPGLASFRGASFHSARWQHDYDLTGRRVAVIGTGASAVQLVPELQPRVQQLSLFQRTAAWVLPRGDRAITRVEQALFAHFPATQRLARAGIYLRRELIVFALRRPRVMRVLEQAARRCLQENVPDPALRAKLTPNFRLGCKRILLSNDYLPALTRPNVEVVTTPIREVRAHAIVTDDGREHPVDAIVFSTGFHVADMPFARLVRGRHGLSLQDAWEGSPEAHLGTTVHGFPNLFFLLGPSTGLGHSSVLHMLESQLELVLGVLRHMRRHRVDTIEPRAEAQAEYVREVQKKMEGTVWVAGGCASWYLDAKGRNTTLWPSFTFSFRNRARFHPEDYAFARRGEAARAQVAAE